MENIMANPNIKINLDSLKEKREWKRHKVKDGNNQFRIGPPHGETSNGYPYRKWQIIWGLSDPQTGRQRPYASSLTTEKRCPVSEFVALLTKKADDMKSTMKASGSPESDIKDRLKDLNDLISQLRPKTTYVYNGIDKSGEIGLLELKTTAHKKMKAEMTQYVKDYNQDPTSLNAADDDSGVWFNVIRTGTGFDTEYDVKKCQSKVKNAVGKVSFEDDRSPLPESVVENYEEQAYDLATIYQIKSYDELAEILEANMPNIVELCPDADVTGVIPPAPVAFSKQQSKPLGTKKVETKLVDDEDEEQPTVVVHKSNTVSYQASDAEQDDFMKEAEAILRS
jgi:hypothetical protein